MAIEDHGDEAGREPADTPSAAPEAPSDGEAGQGQPPRKRRISTTGTLIGLLLGLLGFSLVVQLRSNATDTQYSATREEDLVRILFDLDAREDRLAADITELKKSRDDLNAGAASQERALAEARDRADDLGILAGTLRAHGPGLKVTFNSSPDKQVTADKLLNAVQELRGAGAEAMQIDGNGGSVRIIASTSFVDDNGSIRVDGTRLTGPYTISAIGDAQTMRVALRIIGGVVGNGKPAEGNVIVSDPVTVDITATRSTPTFAYARPVP